MSAHNGKTVRCFHDDADDVDAEPRTLTFEEHGKYEQHLSGEDHHGTALRERFEAAALRFRCPDCGRDWHTCPVCSEPDDTDDNTPAGWFRGDSTGDQIPCHNCNQQEVAAQRRGY